MQYRWEFTVRSECKKKTFQKIAFKWKIIIEGNVKKMVQYSYTPVETSIVDLSCTRCIVGFNTSVFALNRRSVDKTDSTAIQRLSLSFNRVMDLTPLLLTEYNNARPYPRG